MRVNRKLIVFLGLVLAGLCIPTIYAYGTTTHSFITLHAYLDAHNIHVNFFTALGVSDGFPIIDPSTGKVVTRTAQGWLIDGSVREDKDDLMTTDGKSYSDVRVLYHFLDPLVTPTPNTTLTGGISFLSPLCSGGGSPSWLWATGGNGTGSATVFVPLKGNVTYNLSSYSTWPWAITGLSGTEQGALYHFLQGLTSGDHNDRATEFGLMFESLGHVIHLLQDAAQPQHVRNDAHANPPSDGLIAPFIDDLGLRYCSALNPSDYETYVDTNLPNNPQWFTGYTPPAFAPSLGPVNFFFGIAQFTNSNFVSRGTNCNVPPTASCSIAAPCDCGSHTSTTSGYALSYPFPKFSGPGATVLYVNFAYGGDSATCKSEWTGKGLPASDAAIVCSTAMMTFYPTTVTDSYTGKSTQNLLATSSSIFDSDLPSPNFTLNNYNYDQQAAILVPMAEGYSAGVLNYFFRGSMTAGGNSNGFTITNNTMNGSVSEAMSGQFSLYYDDMYGNRNPTGGPIPLGGPWTISIPGNSTASTDINGNPLSFTPPSDAATPGQYILVFQGHSPDPFGTVAGAIVTIPSVIPPPQ